MTDEDRGGTRVRSVAIAEMLLIVVSILLAFALDSWWDRQSEAADYRELTGLLLADFAEAREQLRSNIQRGEVRVEAGEALMAALMDPSAVGADSLQALFPSIWRPVVPVPAPASYRAAMSSGAVTMVENPRLFRALSAVDRAQNSMDTYWRLSADIHYMGAMAQVESSIGSIPVLMGEPTPKRFVPADYVATVSRPDVYSASRLAVQASGNLLESLKAMERAMTRAIEELEASAGR